MKELIEERPLIIQLFDWSKFLGYCKDTADFSAHIAGKSANYLIAQRTMRFNPSPEVLKAIRHFLIKTAKSEPHQGRAQLLNELVESIDAELLGTSEEGGDQ